MDFEYDAAYGTKTMYGCGATLHNVFWYFGGTDVYTARQVKLQKLLDIHLFYFRRVKLLDVSWNVKPIWNLILKKVHATPSINLMKKSFFASLGTMTDNATREYF